MPATSLKQKKFMDAVAHNPAFAKKVGVPKSVGVEFSTASKGKKFGKGGATSRADVQSVNQPKTNHGAMALFKQGGQIMAKSQGVASSPMGKVRTAAPSRDGIVEKGKTKGKNIVMSGSSNGMKKGGMAKKMGK